MAAGVFSRCFQAKTSNDEVCIISVFRIAPVYFILHSCFNILMQGFARCCQDPVMHERITKEVKQWVWSTAPGEAPRAVETNIILHLLLVNISNFLWILFSFYKTSFFRVHLWLDLQSSHPLLLQALWRQKARVWGRKEVWGVQWTLGLDTRLVHKQLPGQPHLPPACKWSKLMDWTLLGPLD